MRLTFKSIGVAAMAAGCLALAACSSSPGSQGSGSANGPGNANAGTAAGQAGKPVNGGTGTVKQGNKIICVMKVANGTGKCEVPAKRLPTGTSSLVGTYKGTGYGSSQSNSVPVTVNKE